MKKFAFLAFALFSYTHSFSQAIVTITDYQKAQEPAIQYEIPYPEATVTKALEDTLEKQGYKGKDSKGYTLYRDVRSSAIGPDTYNLYFRIDHKSKNEKETSIVTLMITKDDIFISEATDMDIVTNAKAYLQNLKPIVQAYDLEQQISSQIDAVRKADKKLGDLRSDSTDIAKREAKIQLQIQDNISSIAAQKADIERQKLILETLKAKRK
ncbi:MAG TPA: hypothetical protein VK718_08820 [Ferruginibacter sp.]|jgi:hypothetical protein|nr:hypothetical protein [Ferruginibacter sp.]